MYWYNHTPINIVTVDQLTQYYSVKHKTHCIKYEILISLRDSRIISCSNGFPGATHDLTISRRTGTEQKLINNGEISIGDKAYSGSNAFVTPYKQYRGVPLTEDQQNFNLFLEQYRNGVERVNSRLKIFKVVEHKWRHPLVKHPLVFRVVALIVNMSLTLHPLNNVYWRENNKICV